MMYQIEVIITSKDSVSGKPTKERVMLDPHEDFESYRFLSVWVSGFTKKMKSGDRLSFQVHPYSPNLPFL